LAEKKRKKLKEKGLSRLWCEATNFRLYLMEIY